MRSDTMSRREDIYRDAVAVIARDYPTDLTVESVAHAIGTSRRQLQRVFDEVGGASFRQVLTHVRMRNASVLLRDTDAPVAAIARQVGYSQPAQFAKTFRRLYGDPPSLYRTSPAPAAAASDPLDAAARPSLPGGARTPVLLGRAASSVQVAPAGL